MSEYKKDSEIERTRGALTARVAAGKGLNPKDYDEDGTVESPAKEYRGAVHNAIQRKKGGVPDGKDTSSVREDFIHEAGRKKKSDKPQKFDVRTDIQNTVNTSPTQGENEKVRIVAHNELEGELISETGYSKFLKKVHSLQEKAVSQNQQQLAGMALAYLRGEMPAASEEVKQMAKMGEKKLRDFAKTKHKGLPEKVKEEMECGSDDKKKKGEEEDPRSMKTKANLVTNKLRAMGLKMSYEPEGEQIDELAPLAIGAGMAAAAAAPYLLKKFAKPAVDKAIDKPATGSGGLIDKMKQRRDVINQMNSYDPEGEQIDERTRYAKETGKNVRTGRPSVEGGDPRVKERNKPPVKIGGSRQEPKERGKKPPVAGEPGSGIQDPAHRVALRRASAERAKEQRPGSRFD
jgi:hypothetical protein